MPNRAWILLLIVSLPYFVNLGVSTIWDVNEAFYAEAPREMIESGDLLTPRFNFEYRLQKPILPYWAVIPFYYAFGVSELSERIPIAICAVLTIFCTYLLGLKLFDKGTGLLAALSLATSAKFFFLARRSIIDLLLILFVTASLLAFALGYRERRYRYFLAFYLLAGVGSLIKGLVGLVLPLSIAGIFLLSRRDWQALKAMRPHVGFSIVLATSAPWYVAMAVRHGSGYLDFFFIGNHLMRFLYGTYSEVRPIWYYAPVIVAGFYPWSLFLPAAFWLAASELRKSVSSDEASVKASHSFVIIWFFFIFCIFSLSKAKQEEYVLELYPAAALLVGRMFASSDGLRSRALSKATAILTLLLAVANLALAGFAFLGGRKLFAEVALNWLPALILAAAGAAMVWSAVKRDLRMIFNATFLSAFAVLAFIVIMFLPAFEKFKPVKPFAAQIRKLAREDDLVGTYKLSLPSLCFYLKRPIFETFVKEELERTLASGRRVFCVMQRSDYEDLASSLRLPLRVIAQRPKFWTTMRGLLALRSDDYLEQFYLVTNAVPPGSNPCFEKSGDEK